MKVKVKFTSTLREIAGQEELELDLPDMSTAGDAMAEVLQQFGPRILGEDTEYQWRHRANYIFLVHNKVAFRLENAAQIKLRNEDVISLVPPIAGG